jgi:hypothetical protein
LIDLKVFWHHNWTSVRKSDPEPRIWKQNLLEILQELGSILQRIPDMRPVPATPGTAALRWRIVQRQMEQLQRMRLSILEDMDRIELALVEGHWPAASTQANIDSLREGRTPPSWR